MPVTAGHVLDLISDHHEQFEEAPNTADLREALLAIPRNAILDAKFMQNYLGKPAQDAA